MEYYERVFLYELKRKIKAEFENNLWKERFKELNGFPVEEGFGKENIIMPFSENDYLENKTLDKETELMHTKHMEEKLVLRPMTEEERKNNLDGSLLFRQHLTLEEVRKACISFLKLNDEYYHEIDIWDDGIDVLTYNKKREKSEKEMIKNRQVCETCKHWDEGIKAEYYPYPPNATCEEKEEINKKHIEEWKEYLKPLTK